MKNYMNMPENFELSDKLSSLLDRILNVLTIDSVFLSQLQTEGKSGYYFITAFVDVNIDPIPNEVIALVSKIEKEYPDFKIRVYTEAQSELALDRGCLYFVEHCCLGATLFAHAEGENILDYKTLALNTLLKRAVRYFDAEMQKIKAFIKAADELIIDKQYGIAAFNLHQSFELSFRFIEQMCLGKNKITHSIISHIKYCEPFFHNLRPFSGTQHMENNELLLLLEHAYSVARYGDEYQITEKQTHHIRSELERFLKEVEILYKKHLNNCRQRIDGIDDEKTIYTSVAIGAEISETEKETVDDVIQEAVLLIEKKMNPTHIYHLGKRTISIYDESHLHDLSGNEIRPTQYWILVISKEGNVAMTSEIVDAMQQKHYEVNLCICLETPKSFHKKLNKQNRLFKQAVLNGELLFKSEHATDFTTDSQFLPRERKKIRRSFMSRCGKARNYLLAAESLMDAPLIEVHFISLAVEQVCLGLIYGVWQYQPNNCSLSHLMKLCGYFYPEIMDYFPLNTEHDKSLHQLLRNVRTQLRSLNRDKEVEDINVDMLMLRTKGFMESSTDFIYMAF